MVSDMVQAEAAVNVAIGQYNALIGEIVSNTDLLQAEHGVAVQTVALLNDELVETKQLNEAIAGLTVTANGLNLAVEIANDFSDTILDGIPDTLIAGFSNGGDFLKAAKSPVAAAQRLASYITQGVAFAAESTAEFLGTEIDSKEAKTALLIEKEGFKLDIQAGLTDLENMLGDEPVFRLQVFEALEALRQISDAYRAKLVEGQALLDERAMFNKIAAGTVQDIRYQDMAFRVFRNDALSKYRSAFDLAARYAYMAAKAYDYETNLDTADAGSATSLLEDIVSARVLGEMGDGGPVAGSGGLADALAKMRDNFQVLWGQLGINNAQSEDSKISLREELFRIKKGAADDAAWAAEIAKYQKADLWQEPEFRRFCRPFAAPGTAQPGLMIPFSTEVRAGKNVFGKPLGPKDHAFDPTLYATRVNATGVWFENYDTSKLSTAPRVYLVPAGMDLMTIPTSRDLQVRAWNVVDQKVPVPHALGRSPLGVENWFAAKDTLDGGMGDIRKFSSFRAYPTTSPSAPTDDEINFQSRLVGRSVWNTRWLLIIPGQTFNADASKGLTDFQASVKDIYLVFKTFGFSGN